MLLLLVLRSRCLVLAMVMIGKKMAITLESSELRLYVYLN